MAQRLRNKAAPKIHGVTLLRLERIWAIECKESFVVVLYQDMARLPGKGM